ncbi:MAG TPA: CBS domain-containing protein [Gaiellaceae bacterium]|nr:CBS domain-containing protein [Gaiellaceae bacterium]
MDSLSAPFGPDQTVADVMLAEPKTLPADATVADVRRVLDDHHVQLLLLADGGRFRGAIAEIPADADDAAPAATCVQPDPATIGPGEPASVGFERAKENPHRRIVVVDDHENLLGLLCLKESLTGFCGRPSRG